MPRGYEVRTLYGKGGTPKDLLFWNAVAIQGDGDCWEWLGCKNVWDYGQFWNRNSQRVAYESAHDVKLKKSQLVLHTCDNRGCCNPAHLYVGTHMDNVKDKIARGRLRGRGITPALSHSPYSHRKIGGMIVRSNPCESQRLST